MNTQVKLKKINIKELKPGDRLYRFGWLLRVESCTPKHINGPLGGLDVIEVVHEKAKLSYPLMCNVEIEDNSK